MRKLVLESENKNLVPYMKPPTRVARINLDTNKVDKIYESVTEAARENNTDGPNISTVLSGRGKTCAGYGWMRLPPKKKAA